jgi:dCTP deaminase
MLLTDHDLAKRQRENAIFSPFIPEKVSGGVVSYGLSQAGYDIRIGPNLKVLSRWNVFKEMLRTRRRVVLDPKNPNPRLYKDVVVTEGSFVIPVGGSVLARSHELICMPDDALAIIIGKSTYARNDLLVNTTPAEPGWRGFLTLELTNLGRLPIRVYTFEGIAQFIFIAAAANVAHPYEGKYQDQGPAPILGRVE